MHENHNGITVELHGSHNESLLESVRVLLSVQCSMHVHRRSTCLESGFSVLGLSSKLWNAATDA